MTTLEQNLQELKEILEQIDMALEDIKDLGDIE